MKKYIQYIAITILSILMTALVYIDHSSASDKDGAQSLSVVEEKEEPLKVSEQAIKNFRIVSKKFRVTNGQVSLPSSAVILSKDKIQIFEVVNSSYELHDVSLVKAEGANRTVSWQSEKLEVEIVIDGVNFLKVVDLSRDEDEGGGHSH